MPVTAKLAYEIFHIELWHILSLIFIIGVNYFITLKARKTPLLYSYLSAQAMLVIWIVSKIFKTVSPDIQLRWFFIVTQYFGVSFLGGTLIVFAYIYSKKKLPSIGKLFLWNIPAFYSFIVVVTNPLHYKFYSRFTFYGDRFGPLFYINMTITYIYLIITIGMLSRGFLKMFSRERKRAYLFAVGIIIPLVINVFYILDIFEALFDYHPLFDYTPIATNISLIFFALAAFQYRFLDILPMAGQQIYDGINDAIVIVDKNNHIISQNRSFCNLNSDKKTDDTLPTELINKPSDKLHLSDSIYQIIYKQKKKFTMIRLIDTTAVDSMLHLLKIRNSELSKSNDRLEQLLSKKRHLADIKTRNFILQELHDILGHATVLAISACEVDILSGAKNYTSTLSSVKKLLDESNHEFNLILSTEEAPNERTSLLIASESLIASIGNCPLDIELVVQGTVFELKSLSSEACYRLCQETITNSIKHSNATSLSFIYRYNEENLEIFAIDNGNGCETITYGKGLNGMVTRFTSISGYIEFSSDINCGFHIHAKIPRK